MINQKRSPTSMLAWLLAMILIPYVAVPIYLIIGSRKRIQKYLKSEVTLPSLQKNSCSYNHAISTVLVNNGIRNVSEKNTFELYSDGVDAFDALMKCFESAKQSIYISTYVFKNDFVTQRILTLLTQKAQAGVEVKLLIDCIGSWQLYFAQRPLKPLIKAGARVEFFMPLFKMPFRNYINLRNHRKIYLVDQQVVLTGGMNLSNEYLGPQTDEGRWEDLLFKVEGDSVCHLYNLFAQDWYYAAHEKIEPMHQVDGSTLTGKQLLQVVPSGPDIPSDALYESLLSAIFNAESRVWVVTPYFIPSEALLKALIIAHRKNVDVRIITPRVSNHLIADLVRSGYMRTLHEAGVKIALYEGVMLHAKAILFDDDAVMLGSVNLDNRSLFLNYEVAMYAYSESIIEEVHMWMLQLLEKSSYELKPRSRIRKFGENFMKITAPLL